METRGNFIQKTITDLIVLYNPKIDKNSYKNIISNFGDKLIFIPKNKNFASPDDYIPCLFYRRINSNKFLIYFHGNSENIFQIEYYGLDFRSYLNMNIIMVEYPGYFLKTSKNYDSNLIFSESLIVYDWIKTKFNILDSQIFICGRSLGTSPAIYLSSHRNPKALFLISAFTSIKNIGADKFLSFFVEEIFKSIDYIKNVKCSILFIHGLKDPLISYRHSEELYTIAKKYNNNYIEIRKINEMTHNDFNLKKDIIDPILQFIDKLNIDENINNNICGEIIDSEDLYNMPLVIKKIIETYIFDIREFEINNILDKINASILMKISGENMAVVNNSKIFIYNRRFLIDIEIDLNEIKHQNEKIISIYETKDKNLICACEKGNIFKIRLDRKTYTIIDIFSIDDQNFKLDGFFDEDICLITKNYIKIFDSNFSKEILSINNDKAFNNYCIFNKNCIAFMKNKILALNKFQNNTIIKDKEISLKLLDISSPFIGTDEYLIIGDIGGITFFDVNNNFKADKKSIINNCNYQDINEKIINISKIHNNFILASTNCGQIIQITIGEKETKTIISKFIKKMPIFCVLMIDYETLIISGENEIDILSIIHKKEKKEEKSCLIF